MWPFLPDPVRGFIPTYYVFTSLAFCLSIYWAVKRAKSQNKQLKLPGDNSQVFQVNTVLDLSFCIMLGAFIGGRLIHVLYEQPAFYFSHPSYILMFWYGGFVFYGGFIGAMIATWIYWCKKRFDYFLYADLLAPVLAFGYGLGRIGCFTAGCCYGRLSHMPWAVTFPAAYAGGMTGSATGNLIDAPTGIPLHPTQLYCTGWEWLVVIVLLVVERVARRNAKLGTAQARFNPMPGFIFSLWLVLHGLGRAWIEQFRDDFRGQTVFNLSISSWLSIVLVICGIYFLMKTKGPRNVSTAL